METIVFLIDQVVILKVFIEDKLEYKFHFFFV